MQSGLFGAVGKCYSFVMLASLVVIFCSPGLRASQPIAALENSDSLLSCESLFEIFQESDTVIFEYLDKLLAKDPPLQKVFGPDVRYIYRAFSASIQKVRKHGLNRHLHPHLHDALTKVLLEFETLLHSLPIKDVYLLAQYRKYGPSDLNGLISELTKVSLDKLRIADPFDRIFSQVLVNHRGTARERRMLIAGALRKGHLRFIDELMGIPRSDVEELEQKERRSKKLSPDEGALMGLGADHDQWFSNYRVLRQVLNSILISQSRNIVELGSGTGRLGMLIGFLFPDVNYVGVEILPFRFQAAQSTVDRWRMKNVWFKHQDLMSSQPYPVGDFYYLYGPTNEVDINKFVFKKVYSTLQGEGRSAILVNSHWDAKGLESQLAPWPKPFAILTGFDQTKGLRHYWLSDIAKPE